MIFKLGELFSGPGGLAFGAMQALIKTKNEVFKVEHAWANDFDKDTCETYRNNITNGESKTVFCKDIRKLDIKKLGAIDALAFGFPCNDFSVVGEQKGMDGIYGPLYSYGVKVLKYYKPQWFIAENVGGLRNSNDGKAFAKILTELHNAGYNLVPHFYKFEEYEVPQSRHRIIIVGIRNDLDISFKVPFLENKTIKTAREAIETPPLNKESHNHDFVKQSLTVIERLKHIKPGQNAFNAEIPERLRLNIKGVTMSHIYKRLDPDKPSYTITGSGGGGTHVYHWKENRALTNRERARLQTFPDNFKFSGSKESVRKQIGMAVPPLASKIIVESILKCFAKIKYSSIEPNIKWENTHNMLKILEPEIMYL